MERAGRPPAWVCELTAILVGYSRTRFVVAELHHLFIYPLHRKAPDMPVFATVVRYFEEVARHGSIRRAAEHLHVTASAVNRQILKLEEEFGMPLFDRLPRGVRLTAAGELLVTALRRLSGDLAATVSEIDALRGLRRGHVTIATLQFLAESLLPEVIYSLRQKHSGITCSVFTRTSEQIVRAVAEGDADLGICHEPPAAFPVAKVAKQAAAIGAVVSARHPLAAMAQVRMRACLDYPLVLPTPEMELRVLIDQGRPRSIPKFQPAIETNSIQLIKLLLQRNAGVGFLTNLDVAREVAARRLAYVPLSDRGARIPTLCVIVRAGRVLPPAAALLEAYVQAAFGKLGLHVPA